MELGKWISKKDSLVMLEVLSWLKEGKTSWEISMILKRSESVINFHIENIFKKLNATNRAHAIAIALDNHLLTL